MKAIKEVIPAAINVIKKELLSRNKYAHIPNPIKASKNNPDNHKDAFFIPMITV